MRASRQPQDAELFIIERHPYTSWRRLLDRVERRGDEMLVLAGVAEHARKLIHRLERDHDVQVMRGSFATLPGGAVLWMGIVGSSRRVLRAMPAPPYPGSRFRFWIDFEDEEASGTRWPTWEPTWDEEALADAIAQRRAWFEMVSAESNSPS